MAAPTHGSGAGSALCLRFASTFATMELELEHPAEYAQSLQACLVHMASCAVHKKHKLYLPHWFQRLVAPPGLSLVRKHRSGRVYMASEGIRCPHHHKAGPRPGRACGSVQLVIRLVAAFRALRSLHQDAVPGSSLQDSAAQ